MNPETMDPAMIETSLETIASSLKDVISNLHVLFEAKEGVRSIGEYEDITWRIIIDKDKPLKFKESENTRGDHLYPRISCWIEGVTNLLDPIGKLNLVIMLYSDNEDLIFREQWDSHTIQRKMEKWNLPERLMFRCHFDRGVPSSDGEPLYHMHFGGNSNPADLCWIPNSIRSPRIFMPPLDLTLACELVMSTFFPESFTELQEKPEWREIVYNSEYYHLRPYFETYLHKCKGDLLRRRKGNDSTLLWSQWLKCEEE